MGGTRFDLETINRLAARAFPYDEANVRRETTQALRLGFIEGWKQATE